MFVAKRTRAVLVAGVLLGAAGTRAATVRVDDRFDDADRDNNGTTDGGVAVTPSAEISFPFYRQGNGTQAVGTALDSVLGSATNNALTLTSGTGTFSVVAGRFAASPQTYLVSTGDTVSVSFDFRMTGTIAASSAGFRFGLANSNGTTITADQTTAQASADDKSFFVQLGTGGTTGTSVAEESGTATNVLSGADTVALTTASAITAGSAITLNDTAKRSALLTLTKNASGVGVAVSIFDATGTLLVRAAGADSGSTLTAFDEVAFGSGGTTNNFNIDNVVVVTSIPEPATGALVVAPLVVGLSSRRRRRTSL
jgi:hypothetical protein